jgi:hypothetical protein
MKRPLSRVNEWNKLFDRLFYCPSCSTWRLPPSRRPAASVRRASTLSSRTAVNATKTIPARFQPLYVALEELRRAAPAHVSLSRLQLALQGLESETPKIRVAVLGLDVPDTARKVARLLLADALERENDWEKELLKSSKYADGVLLRYGQAPNASLPPTREPIPTLHIPAPALERANLEILVSSISSRATNEQQVPLEAFLAPAVRTPTGADGRQTVISQPMHASLVVVNGFDVFVKLAELLSATNFSAGEGKKLIKVAIEQSGFQISDQSTVAVVDTEKAIEGLAAIRRSIAEATTFEHKWVESGLPRLSTWLLEVADTSGPISPSIRTLISSLVASTDSSINNYLASVDKQVASTRLSPAVLANLESAIDEFSRNAHAELQSGLNSAWSSRNWRKLAWYKLFWRVDDVGLIVTDLITNAWLPRTERAVYELSGRLAQVGISPIDLSTASQALNPSTETASDTSLTQPAPLLQAQSGLQPIPTEPVIINQGGSPVVEIQPISQPTPLSTIISSTRTATINNAIATLHSTSQTLVLNTLSISSLSGLLSALTYVSFTPSLYSAGTIFAFGTVFALYRMQGAWQQATRELEEGLFDEGRRVIQRVVGRMRLLVEEKAQTIDGAEDQGVRKAREAVGRVREELERVVQEGQQKGV